MPVNIGIACLVPILRVGNMLDPWLVFDVIEMLSDEENDNVETHTPRYVESWRIGKYF